MKDQNKVGKPDLHYPKRLDNIGVSDLWFNWDHNDCKRFKDGEFSHYDTDAMTKDADGFIAALRFAGCSEIPEPWQLVEDFHARM